MTRAPAARDLECGGHATARFPVKSGGMAAALQMRDAAAQASGNGSQRNGANAAMIPGSAVAGRRVAMSTQTWDEKPVARTVPSSLTSS